MARAVDTPQSITTFFRQLTARYSRAVEGPLIKMMRLIYQDVSTASPVDTGHFQHRWQMKIDLSDPVKKTGRVYNKTSYARDIELGSVPGKAPWPRVGKSGKTVLGPGGRIFSSQAVGGVITPMFGRGVIEAHVQRFTGDFLVRFFR